jgi:cytochrome c556
LTPAVASLAGDPAAKKDGDAVKTKLGEIKGRCGECHANIREKK